LKITAATLFPDKYRLNPGASESTAKIAAAHDPKEKTADIEVQKDPSNLSEEIPSGMDDEEPKQLESNAEEPEESEPGTVLDEEENKECDSEESSKDDKKENWSQHEDRGICCPQSYEMAESQKVYSEHNSEALDEENQERLTDSETSDVKEEEEESRTDTQEKSKDVEPVSEENHSLSVRSTVSEEVPSQNETESDGEDMLSQPQQTEENPTLIVSTNIETNGPQLSTEPETIHSNEDTLSETIEPVPDPPIEPLSVSEEILRLDLDESEPCYVTQEIPPLTPIEENPRPEPADPSASTRRSQLISESIPFIMKLKFWTKNLM
jgi:hypothetical protein